MTFVSRRKPAKIKRAKAPSAMADYLKSQERKKRKSKRKASKQEDLRRPVYRGPPLVLRPFQRVGVDFLKEHNHNVLLADAPGCGKTPQVLVAIRENTRKLCPVLVVVPASVVQNWRNEAERWIPGVRVSLADKLSEPLDPNAHITVTTWDLLASRSSELSMFGFRYLVCDEAHYAKNPDAQRTQGLMDVASMVHHVTLLTGTPLVNDADEYRVIKGLIDRENAEPPVIRRLLEDVAPDIPPKRRVTLEAAIPDEIRNEYNEVVEVYEQWLNEYLPQVLDNPVIVDSVAERAMNSESLSKLSYLRRVLGRGKVPAAAAWAYKLVKAKEQVVIFGQYVDVLDLLGQALSKLGITYVRLDGSTSKEQRQAAVEAFQRGDIDVFVGSQAAREGITLHKACNLLFLERWWTPAAEEQAEDRIRRIGQTRPTTIYYLHAENSLDDRINDIVERKRILVSQHIGTADIESSVADEVLDVWRRIKVLRDGVPLLSENPSAALDLPPLPDAKRVFSVIFDSQKWPIDALQRYLRKNKYRTREIKRDKLIVKIQTRAKSSFRKGTIKRRMLAQGIWLEMGRPETRDAARMKTVRAERKRLKKRRLSKRVVKSKRRSKRHTLKLS